ncbi:hypothetical protein P171DRAFT_4489 [Karstenula rhodostoma CBS 690.94]|uniref:Fungal N-terminal domain-containing protein n=1 Tax=Karstenula rhodostoma CBS 690.94 TaxID=1392251 RepID=A0A9P4UI61_9PLEO|nr:hypothetical protein P171DRAFT_4489 [Karstenula rhodostoma CBS 690.94]
MDPLSITSGVVAVLSASGKTAQGIEKLWGLRHREKHFRDLILTIEGLHIQFKSVKPVLDYIQTNHEDVLGLREGLNDIEALCEETKKTFASLDRLIGDFRPNGARKPKKTMWIFRKADLLRLKQQAKYNTRSLTASLNTFSNVHSCLKIDMLHSRLEVPTHISTNDTDNLLRTAERTGNLEVGSLNPTSSTESFFTASCDDWYEALSKTSILDRVPSTGTNINCKQYCRCKCHSMFKVSTSRWIKRILGAFMFSGGGPSPYGRGPCDQEDCCRNGRIYVQISYMAPSWMFLHALVLCVQAQIVAGTIRSYNISIPRTIGYTAKVWSIVELGYLSELRALFVNGLATAYDIALDGTSLLKYAVVHQQYEVYSFLLTMGANPLLCDQSGVKSQENFLQLVFQYIGLQVVVLG